MSLDWKDFQGVNAGYVLEQYEKFRTDPSSVDEATRDLFARWTPPDAASTEPRIPSAAHAVPGPQHSAQTFSPTLVVGVVNLAQSIRRYGHLAAEIDPLGGRPAGDPALLPETHGISEADLRALPAWLIDGPVAQGASSAFDVIERLRQIYCSTTGYDIAHIFVPEERQWLREAIETGRYRAPNDPIDPIALLDRLTDVEVFERFLHRTFPGKTRFSIEGLDMLVPILDEVITEAAESGIRRAFAAMAHRGR
jgi:2-oxoglutarate dehydrogenase E1 component